MATSNTSPLASPPASTADNVTSQPPEPSTPSPNPSKNGNPPEPSPLSPPPPPAAPVASPPAISPPPVPVDLPPNSKPTTNTSPPPAPAKSPTPPTTITPSPEPPTSSPPPPTQVTVPIPTSQPPPSPPPPPSSTPTVPSPPSAPPSSPPPPPPPPPPPLISKTPSSSPSTPAHSSPPPPAPKSKLPVSQPPPPHISHPTPPPPLNKPTGSPPLATQPPKSSPSAPVQDPPTPPPSRNTTSSSSSLIFSPPPLSSSPGPFVSSSPASISANSTTSGKGGVPMGGIVALGLVLGFVMLGVIGLVALYISKRKRREFKHSGGYIVPSPFGSSPQSDSNLIVKTVVSSSAPFGRSSSGSGTLSPHSHGGLRQSRSWFTYQELYEATNGFSLEDLLGEGGFGCVYKGVLANGREVAVKQLKIGASQGEREFQAEVEIISRIHHRHLVSLDGYCISGSKRLLVYEYVPNQTLYYHLHGDNMPVMDWATRIKIVVGAAKGIAYLHEDCHPRIIHRDIKSSNILLDDKFEARVADFGLAKLALDVDTHVSTRVMGTFGYMAPEYATSGKPVDESQPLGDVYSFGVVLLELLTGRKPVDESQPLGDESLVEWARPLLSHALETGEANGLVDPRLEKNYVESELFLLIEASAACVRHSATKRPGMGQVVRALGGLSPSDLSNGMRVGQSEIYDSAQQSAEIRWFRRMAFGSQGYSTDYFSEAQNMGCPLNSNQTNQGPVLSAQHSQNDRSKQHSQSIYFSSHRTQGPSFSRQWSQDSAAARQTAQNPVFQPQSSQNGLI